MIYQELIDQNNKLAVIGLGYVGLPIALEFAKKIEVMEPKKEQLLLNPGKNKVFTINELRAKIEKEYGTTPWGKRLFDDIFRWL